MKFVKNIFKKNFIILDFTNSNKIILLMTLDNRQNISNMYYKYILQTVLNLAIPFHFTYK